MDESFGEHNLNFGKEIVRHGHAVKGQNEVKYSLLPMYTHHCFLPPSTLVQLHRVYMVSNIMVNILIRLCIKSHKCRDRMVMVGELEEDIGWLDRGTVCFCESTEH